MSQWALRKVTSQRYISSQRYIPNNVTLKKRTVCILRPVPAFGWAPVTRSTTNVFDPWLSKESNKRHLKLVLVAKIELRPPKGYKLRIAYSRRSEKICSGVILPLQSSRKKGVLRRENLIQQSSLDFRILQPCVTSELNCTIFDN